MNYPTISEYIESIRFAEDNFATLTNLRPVLDEEGNPIMSSGNFAVVFKMTDGEKDFAVKCFIKEQEGRETAYKQISSYLKNISSKYIVSINYLENEFFVATRNTDTIEFPILVMDWIEGKSLDKHIKDLINTDDKHACKDFKTLALNFIDFASWMCNQEFAHGDIKPDNIMITKSSEIVLIDYDGMFVPIMKGQNARELGTPNYKHPNRKIEDFNSAIDDFSLTVLSFSLAALAVDRGVYNKQFSDALVLSENNFRNPYNSTLMKKLCYALQDNLCSSLYSSIIIQVEDSKAKIDYKLLFDIKNYINATPPLYLPFKLAHNKYQIYNTVTGKCASNEVFSDCLIVNESIENFIILVSDGGEINYASMDEMEDGVMRVTDLVLLQAELKKTKPQRYALINRNTKFDDLQWYQYIKPISLFTYAKRASLFIAQNFEGRQGVIDSNHIVIPHIYKKISLTTDGCHLICEKNNGEKGLYLIRKEASIPIKILDAKYNEKAWHYKDGASAPSEIIIFNDTNWRGYDLERQCFIGLPRGLKRILSYHENIICAEIWEKTGMRLYNCDTNSFLNDIGYKEVYFHSFEEGGIALCETEEHKNILVFKNGTHYIIPFENYTLDSLGSSSDGSACFFNHQALEEQEAKYRIGEYDLEITVFDYGIKKIYSIIYHWNHIGARSISVRGGHIIIDSYRLKYNFTSNVCHLDFNGEPIEKRQKNRSSDSFKMDTFDKKSNFFNNEELLEHYVRSHYINKETIPSYEDFYEGFDCIVKNGYAAVTGIYDIDAEFGVSATLIGYADKEMFYWNN